MAASMTGNVAEANVASSLKESVKVDGIVLSHSLPTIKVAEIGIVEIAAVMTAEEYVKNYFSDIPVLVEVAKCESRFRQHNKNGGVLRGVQNSKDVGVMQINEYFHLKESKALGYDIYSIEGNTAYARHLFEGKGLAPWKSSSPCWSKSTAYSNYKELAVK